MKTQERTEKFKIHADSALIPPMRRGEYEDLLRDIKLRGIVTPLDVVGEVVLDGRHRLNAAKELGLETVPVREVALNGQDATEYVLKAAVIRRHLTDDQRAHIASLYAKANPKPTGAAAHKHNATPT